MIVFRMALVRAATALIVATVLAGCASTVTRHPEFGKDCAAFDANVDCVRVWYGSNRALGAAPGAAEERDLDVIPPGDGGRLALGRADIWLPKLVEEGGTRKIGETPLAQGKAPDERSEQEKYVFVTRITTAGKERFVGDLQSVVYRRHQGSVLLFVHGFTVEFEAALIRSGQLAFDLSASRDFEPGAPVLFSWPSLGKMSVGSYKKDRSTADAAAPFLSEFLDLLTSDLKVRRVNIVAHSMGNRVLTAALEDYATDYLKNHPGGGIEFRIILAAADVERDVFDLVADKIGNLAPNVTVYASDDDLALNVSRLINKTVRLGDTDGDKPYIRLDEGYETVDATPVASELFGVGHDYYSDNPFILNDIRCAMADRPPSVRALERRIYASATNGPEYFRTIEKGTARDRECSLRRTSFLEGDAPRSEYPAEPIATAPPAPSALYQIIYFDLEQDRLSAEDAALMDELVREANNSGRIVRVRVEGHTDRAGDAERNLVLSRRRAELVRGALIERGVPLETIEVTAFGEDRPAIPTEDGIREPLNRRVEVIIEVF